MEVHGEVSEVCVCPSCRGKGLIKDFWSKIIENSSPVLTVCERCGGTGLVLKEIKYGQRRVNQTF